MTPDAWILLGITVTAAIVVAILFRYLLEPILKGVTRRGDRHAYIKTVVSILRTVSRDEQVRQLERHYSDYAAAQQSVDLTVPSFAKNLWLLVRIYDIRGEDGYKKKYGVAVTADDRNRLAEIVNDLEELHPYADLPSPWATRLEEVRTAIENSEVATGTRALDEMAAELRHREEVLKDKEERREKRNLIYQWVGIVATILTFAGGVIVSILLAH